jgi:hypothetical protein
LGGCGLGLVWLWGHSKKQKHDCESKETGPGVTHHFSPTSEHVLFAWSYKTHPLPCLGMGMRK